MKVSRLYPLNTHTHTHTHTPIIKVFLFVKYNDIRGESRVSGLVFALTERTRSVLSFVIFFIFLFTKI